jgi:hypothetical protein
MLLAALRQSPRQTRAILMLGAIYAILRLLVDAFVPDDQLNLLAQQGGRVTLEQVAADPALQQALRDQMGGELTIFLLFMPIAGLLWHVPALVHWHGLPLGKSLFFSATAVLRNLPAYLVYGLGWLMVSSIGSAALLVLAGLTGNVNLAFSGLIPLGVVVASMFSTSLWFTFRDSFTADAPPADTPPPPLDA